MKQTIFFLILFTFNFANASENLCTKFLRSNDVVIHDEKVKFIYNSESFKLEIGNWGYRVNGHLRTWPDVHEFKGRMLSQLITSTELQESKSELVFTKSTYSFNFLRSRIISGYQFLFKKNSIWLGLPKGSIFVVHEVLLNIGDNETISDTVLGNLINTLDSYTQM